MRINKKYIIEIFKSRSTEDAIKIIRTYNPRKVINPLISFLCHKDPDIKWKAIRCGGEVVSELSRKDMENARIIIRRLMWQLNDESGGIGWGVPELLGEVMYLNEELSKEYINILISYIRADGNYLETPPLRQGAVWAIGRVAERDPLLVKDAIPYIMESLEDRFTPIKGTAIWVSGLIKIKEACPIIKSLRKSEETFELYTQGKLKTLRLRDVALNASEMIPCEM